MRKNYKHDTSKKYECRGGAVVLWGVQKIKKGERKNRGACWAYGLGFGPVLGSG